MTDTLHEITNRALRQWIEVTGVDPEDESWTWGSYKIGQINDYIRAAQDFDPTGLTAFMVTRSVVHDYVGNISFNAMDLIAADSKVHDELEALQLLVLLVKDPVALAAVADFQDQLKDAARHYGVGEKVAATIEDLNELSHIRRDALVCPGMLELHTFAKGAKSLGKLKYNERVLLFWNMNSLIRAAEAQPTDGISIILVRDPAVIEYSFFCFLVRDGENTSIWTDAEKGTHPMQKHMTRDRGRARQLEGRMGKLRFPYQLLNVEINDKGYADEVIGEAMVRTNLEAVPISKLEDLEPDQILWAIMALDVLREGKHQPELSGTGEGMAYQLASGAKAVLPPGYLETAPLTNDDVSSDSIRTQLESNKLRSFMSTGINDWMEQRYKGAVDERLLNLTEPQNTTLELVGPDHETDNWPDDDDVGPQEMILIGGGRIDATALLPNARGFGGQAYAGQDNIRAPSLIGADPVSFGSREEMEVDRLWIARWNQSVAIGMAAVAEYDSRHAEVSRWFRRKVRRNGNVERIIDAAVRGSLKVETSISRATSGFGRQEGGSDELIRWHRRARGGVPGSMYEYWSGGGSDVALFQEQRHNEYPTKKDPLRCVITGEAASIWVLFKPKTPEGIASLAGVELLDLPELLEYWNPDPPYNGNSILDRTDPLDSLIGNPWHALRFLVVLALSKREWNRRVKACPKPGEIAWQIENSPPGEMTFWSSDARER